jgi:hypothetical protein
LDPKTIKLIQIISNTEDSKNKFKLIKKLDEELSNALNIKRFKVEDLNDCLMYLIHLEGRRPTKRINSNKIEFFIKGLFKTNLPLAKELAIYITDPKSEFQFSSVSRDCLLLECLDYNICNEEIKANLAKIICPSKARGNLAEIMMKMKLEYSIEELQKMLKSCHRDANIVAISSAKKEQLPYLISEAKDLAKLFLEKRMLNPEFNVKTTDCYKLRRILGA